MNAAAVALLCSLPLCAATEKLTYTRAFPGSVPEWFCIEIDRAGSLEYKESPTDDQPLKVQLSESDVSTLFDMAAKLDHFNTPLDSGLKVANTGKKTFRYDDGSNKPTEVSFNYSLNPTAQQLLDRFEDIGDTERAWIELDRTIRHDHLGINDALAGVESLWLQKKLAAPKQFIPLLDRITSHESLMHLVRDRAARLKDEFQAAQPAGAPSK